MKLEFGPWGWNLGLEVGIWASRLGFGPQGWDIGLEAEIWAWRLGERGLRRRRRKIKQGTGTADHLTLLRLFLILVDLGNTSVRPWRLFIGGFG